MCRFIFLSKSLHPELELSLSLNNLRTQVQSGQGQEQGEFFHLNTNFPMILTRIVYAVRFKPHIVG